jgi:hypothetical protein
VSLSAVETKTNQIQSDLLYDKFEKLYVNLGVKNRFEITYIYYTNENHRTFIITEITDTRIDSQVAIIDADRIITEPKGINLYPSKLTWGYIFLDEIEIMTWANWKANKIFENSFEWRFEFPEVLDDEGNFVGFDVVIGNPPYYSLSKVKEHSEYFSKANYVTYSKGADIFCLFYELGGNILKPLGFLTYITSNSWLRAIYGELLKKYFIEKLQPIALINIEDVQIFEEATVESNIITLQKSTNSKPFQVVNLSKDYSIGDSLNEYFDKYSFEFIPPSTSEWFIGNQSAGTLKSKIENGARLLKDFNVEINRGFLTGLNEAFIIDENKKNELIKADKKNADIIKPILRGRDLKKYFYTFENVYLVNSHSHLRISVLVNFYPYHKCTLYQS